MGYVNVGALLLVSGRSVAHRNVGAITNQVKKFTTVGRTNDRDRLAKLLISGPGTITILSCALFSASTRCLLVLRRQFGRTRFILFDSGLDRSFVQHVIFDKASFDIIVGSTPVVRVRRKLQGTGRRLRCVYAHTI